MQQQQGKDKHTDTHCQCKSAPSPHLQPPSRHQLIPPAPLAAGASAEGCRGSPAAEHAKTHSGCKLRDALLPNSSKKD